MSYFVWGLIATMIVVILLMLFRIQSLVSILRSSHDEVGTSNKINGALMLIVPILGTIAGVWSFLEARKYFLPEASSVHGKWTDDLFWVTMSVVTLMFFVTNTILFWFAYKYQYQKGRKVSFFHDNTRLEVFWTIVPAVIMAVLVFAGARVWNDTMMKEPKKGEAEIVEIMGKQFGWQVRYPGSDKQLGKYNFRLIDDSAGNEFGIDFEDKNSEDDFVGTKMFLPVGKPVTLKIRARDVLHSVFLPHFRVKMDAVPGMPTHFTFTPTKTTVQMRQDLGNNNFNYELACTEVCGKGHFAMRMIVEVVEQEEYEKWYAEQTPLLKDKPEFKGKGMGTLRKKNLAVNENSK
jgi:cytochrome c oxidase subunit II